LFSFALFGHIRKIRVMLNLKIITLEGIIFSDEVSEIILPTDVGQITVLPGHIPLISKLKEGTVVLKTGSKEKHIHISSGVIEVRPESIVYILVDHASEMG
jgi:F-type H+-transporting ATPase subunit epsilon